MSFLISKLKDKKEIDRAIKTTQDKVLVLRFGKEDDPVCLQLDNIVSVSIHFYLKRKIMLPLAFKESRTCFKDGRHLYH